MSLQTTFRLAKTNPSLSVNILLALIFVSTPRRHVMGDQLACRFSRCNRMVIERLSNGWKNLANIELAGRRTLYFIQHFPACDSRLPP
jgi:hypothetical protein